MSYISVRIYRKEGCEVLINGSGLLFQDNDAYYVLTAHHCLTRKDVDGTEIELNLSKTDVSFYDKKKQVDVTIIGVVDFNEDDDWILLRVERPTIDLSGYKQIRFSTNVEVKSQYESYPYISSMNGKSRYTELTAVNDMGYFHISDNITGGRYAADTIMKGGSGAGIMKEKDDIAYCFGLMKKTLEGGALNDIESVNISSLQNLLSTVAFNRLSELDAKRRVYDEHQKQLKDIRSQINQSNKETLSNIILEILDKTIPSLIDNLQIDQAQELLDLVKGHCEAMEDLNPLIAARYYFLKADCLNLSEEPIEVISECYHQAFLLDATREDHKEHEIRYLYHKNKKEEAEQLVVRLTETNEIRIAFEIAKSDNPQSAFGELPIVTSVSPSFRYRVIEACTNMKQIIPEWIFEDYIPVLPKMLTYTNLREWLFLFTYYRVQLRDFLFLLRMDILPNQNLYCDAFRATSRYLELASNTPLACNQSIINAFHYYWGFLLDGDQKWLTEYEKINVSKMGDQYLLCSLQYASMISLCGKYNEAFLYISEKQYNHEDILLQFIIKLSSVSGNVSFLMQYITQHKNTKFLMGLDMCNSLAGLSVDSTRDDYCKVICSFEYEKDAYRQILLDIYALKEGIEIDATKYPDFITDLSGILAASAAQIMSANGMQQQAVAYLRNMVDNGSDFTIEYTYMLLLQRDRMLADELFKCLQGMRKSNKVYNINQLLMEYNMSVEMSDLPNALEAISIVYNIDPDNERYFAYYLYVLGKVRPQELLEHVHTIFNIHFSDIQLIIVLYHTLAENGYVEEAAEFLYKYVVELDDEYLSSFFDKECITGFLDGLMNNCPDVITENGFVIIETNESKKDLIKIKPKTILGQALIGHKVGDIVEVELIGIMTPVKIIAILNKFGYQHNSHLRETIKTGGNGMFKPIYINTTDPSSMLKQLEQAIGANNDEKNTYKEYADGRQVLMNMLHENDVIGDYYKFLFSSFKLYVEPYLVCRERKAMHLGCNKEYYLDMTSLLLLFEFHQFHPSIKYPKKFHLSAYLCEVIKSYKKNFRIIRSLSLYETMSQRTLHHFSDDYTQNLEMRFDTLLAWIDSYCEVQSDPDVLKLDTDIDNIQARMFCNIYVCLVGDAKQDNVLITEDMNMEIFFRNLMPFITTETFLYEYLGESLGKEFSIFLCENNCIGACLPEIYIYEQFFLMEKKKENKFQNILDFKSMSVGVCTMLNVCNEILRDAYNKPLAELSVETLLQNFFAYINPLFFVSSEWNNLISYLWQGKYNGLIISELEKIAKNNKNRSLQ